MRSVFRKRFFDVWAAIPADASHSLANFGSGGKGPELKTYDRLVTARDYPIYGFECHFARTLGERKWLDGIKFYIAPRSASDSIVLQAFRVAVSIPSHLAATVLPGGDE